MLHLYYSSAMDAPNRKEEILKCISLWLKLSSYKTLTEEDYLIKLPFYLDYECARLHLKTPFVDKALFINAYNTLVVDSDTNLEDVIVKDFLCFCLTSLSWGFFLIKFPAVMSTPINVDVVGKYLGKGIIIRTGALLNYEQQLERMKQGHREVNDFPVEVLIRENKTTTHGNTTREKAENHYNLMLELWNNIIEKGYIPINVKAIQLEHPKYRDYCISSLNSAIEKYRLIKEPII